MEILEAIRLALPYCKETIAERNARLAQEAALQPKIDGPFDCASDLVAAQSRVMALMASGSLPSHVGKTFIESLALMVKTQEIVVGGADATLRVVGGLPDLPQDEAPDTFSAVGSLQEHRRDAS